MSRTAAPKRLDAYIRVSAVRGREGESFTSPEDQERRIRAWAESQGHVIDTAWHELDVSGGSMDRPMLNQVLERIEQKASDGIPPSLESLALDAQDSTAKPSAALPGRWRLGWRGNEHARMNREIRIANIWNEFRLKEQTNKRMKRSHTDSLASALSQKPRKAPASSNAADPEESAWQFWSQHSLARRKLWGTDVYTDDSDVLAMCVHAGWIEAPRIPNVPEWLGGGGMSGVSRAWADLSQRQEQAVGGAPPRPAAVAQGRSSLTCDLSVTLRIAPKLILYKGCHRGGIQSRSWGNTHDGVSLVVESVELRPVRGETNAVGVRGRSKPQVGQGAHGAHGGAAERGMQGAGPAVAGARIQGRGQGAEAGFAEPRAEKACWRAHVLAGRYAHELENACVGIAGWRGGYRVWMWGDVRAVVWPMGRVWIQNATKRLWIDTKLMHRDTDVIRSG